jgi:hypothetical protein
VLTNRNAPNGAEPILTAIGGLPPGTPASGAAHGTSWLTGLLEDYGLPRTWCIHRGARQSPRPAEERQGRCRNLGTAAPRGPAAGGVGRPPAIGQLRALLRHRAQLVRLRELLRHAAAGTGRALPGRTWQRGRETAEAEPAVSPAGYLAQFLLGIADPGDQRARTRANPASVSWTGRVPRSTGGRSIARSRVVTCWLTADYVIWRAQAAPEKEPQARRSPAPAAAGHGL